MNQRERRERRNKVAQKMKRLARQMKDMVSGPSANPPWPDWKARRFDRLSEEFEDLRAERKKLDTPPPPGEFGARAKRLCLHEAAHAAMARAKNYEVEGLYIRYRDGRPVGGKCVVHHRRGRVPAVLRMAGRVADMWGKRSPGRTRFQQIAQEGQENGVTDWVKAARDVHKHSGRRGEPRTLRDAWEEARATLMASWPTVERLADKLASTPGGELSGGEVHRICEDVKWKPARK